MSIHPLDGSSLTAEKRIAAPQRKLPVENPEKWLSPGVLFSKFSEPCR
jgi:hypothetical protein